MFKRQTSEILYFSTTVELKINGVVYRPAICYKVPPLAKNSLEKFVEGGKVTFYENPVRFVNGAVVSGSTPQPVVGVPSFTREVSTEKPARKKNK